MQITDEVPQDRHRSNFERHPGVVRRLAASDFRAGAEFAADAVDDRWRLACEAEGVDFEQSKLAAGEQQAAAQATWIERHGRDWSVGSYEPPKIARRAPTLRVVAADRERSDRGAPTATTEPADSGDAPAPRLRLHLDRRAAQLAAAIADAPRSALLSRKQLAAWLGLHPGTLKRLDREGAGPPIVYAGLRKVRYRVGDCLTWLERRASARGGA